MCGVCPKNKDDLRLIEVIQWVDATFTARFFIQSSQQRQSGEVSDIVHIVGSDDKPGNSLENVIFLVCAF